MDAPMDVRDEFQLLMEAYTNLILELREQFPGLVVEDEIRRSVAKLQETFVQFTSFAIFNRKIVSLMQSLEFYRVYWNLCKICRIPQSSVEPEEDLPNCT